MVKVKVELKDIPKCTPEMIEELRRRARIPNPNRTYPELPEWKYDKVLIPVIKNVEEKTLIDQLEESETCNKNGTQ